MPPIRAGLRNDDLFDRLRSECLRMLHQHVDSPYDGRRSKKGVECFVFRREHRRGSSRAKAFEIVGPAFCCNEMVENVFGKAM